MGKEVQEGPQWAHLTPGRVGGPQRGVCVCLCVEV